MSTATIAALEACAAAQTLSPWLKALPADAPRAQLERALQLDRRLWTQYPASLASCLLARTLELPGLAALREAWMAELDSRGTPWIRPLRALPAIPGLLTELRGGPGFSLEGLERLRFLSDRVVVLEPIHFHPSVQAPELRRGDRLRWDWERGEATLEPYAPSPEPAEQERYPRFESDGWGPVYLVRAPGRARESLPCPPKGSASARFSADGRQVYVYGTYDEYAGGFAAVLDSATLDVKRWMDTGSPVSSVQECPRAGLLLLQTYRGAGVWKGPFLRTLSLTAKREVCLSPDGQHVATFDGCLQLWLLDELLQGGRTAPREGFPTCFDPSGARLLSGRRLFDGHTGERIAGLAPGFKEYLEGGPPSPWFHLGERFLVCLLSDDVWDTRSGTLLVEDFPTFSQLNSVAYDCAGSRLAALRQGQRTVHLHALPHGRRLQTVDFDLAGMNLAISADGSMLAVRGEQEVEVRDVSGALLRRFAHPRLAPEARNPEGALRFSADGQRIASFREGDGWRIQALQDEHAEHLGSHAELEALADFAAPHPPDWDIETGNPTVFVHRPTGTRIALPAAGPWVCNPAYPWIVACDELHAELRAR